MSLASEVAGTETSTSTLASFAPLTYWAPCPVPFASVTDVGGSGAMIADALCELSAPSQLWNFGVTVYCQRPVGRASRARHTVRPVNDAPLRSGTLSDLTVLENSGLTSLGLGTVGYGAGGGSDEAGQGLTYTVTGVPTTLGDIVLADGTTVVAVNATYTLAQLQGMQFRAGSNATGGPQVFSWQVQDSGGVADGGVDRVADALAIQIANTNQAPVLNGANALAAIDEDPSANDGTAVSALVAGHVTDANVNAVTGIAVVAVDTTHGSWQYSTDGGGNWATLAGCPTARRGCWPSTPRRACASSPRPTGTATPR